MKNGEGEKKKNKNKNYPFRIHCLQPHSALISKFSVGYQMNPTLEQWRENTQSNETTLIEAPQ